MRDDVDLLSTKFEIKNRIDSIVFIDKKRKQKHI